METNMNDLGDIKKQTRTAKPVRPANAPLCAPAIEKGELGQIVFVFQGGGALGAYQAGVFQALHESGMEPDWVIGTSIGAINASIIAGNAPENRVARLREFWRRIKHNPYSDLAGKIPFFGPSYANALTALYGVRNFFEPNPLAHMGMNFPLGAESAGFYSTAPLEKTLNELVDFDILNNGKTRLTVGAANVRTAEMKYFDTKETRLTARHIMASGALPPAFPAIRIDGELYWDGGVLSNTPVERVFDEYPRYSGVIFAVHVWNPQGDEPDTIQKVLTREKDLRYSSRAHSHIARQKQLHKLRHVITRLAELLPEEIRDSEKAKILEDYGCNTVMHVVRLLAPPIMGEDQSKDIDFSPDGIRTRWDFGYLDTSRVLMQKPWTHQVDQLEGFVLHEAAAGEMMFEG
jgi:NTE family protein